MKEVEVRVEKGVKEEGKGEGRSEKYEGRGRKRGICRRRRDGEG